MKVYKESDTTKKRWALNLDHRDGGDVSIIAVDSITGAYVAHLVRFHAYGGVSVCGWARDAMKERGYDPYEHNNRFDENGSLVIS